MTPTSSSALEGGACREKATPTLSSPVIVTVHVGPVLQPGAPVQLTVDPKPKAGDAVRVTWAPSAKSYEQEVAKIAEPQLMPDGLLLTFPFPLVVTVSVCCGGAG